MQNVLLLSLVSLRYSIVLLVSSELLGGSLVNRDAAGEQKIQILAVLSLWFFSAIWLFLSTLDASVVVNTGDRTFGVMKRQMRFAENVK